MKVTNISLIIRLYGDASCCFIYSFALHFGFFISAIHILSLFWLHTFDLPKPHPRSEPLSGVGVMEWNGRGTFTYWQAFLSCDILCMHLSDPVNIFEVIKDVTLLLLYYAAYTLLHSIIS